MQTSVQGITNVGEGSLPGCTLDASDPGCTLRASDPAPHMVQADPTSHTQSHLPLDAGAVLAHKASRTLQQPIISEGGYWRYR